MAEANEQKQHAQTSRWSGTIPGWLQNIVGSLVVAGLLAMVSGSISNRLSIGGVAVEIESIKADIAKIDEFHAVPRFVETDYMRLIAPINLQVERLEEDISKLEVRVNGLAVDVNGMKIGVFKMQAAVEDVSIDEFNQVASKFSDRVGGLESRVRKVEARLKLVGK